MSLFTKRKGRRISSFEDDEEPTSAESPDPVVKPIRFGKRPMKQSALRRSINIHDLDSLGTDPSDSKSDAAEDAPKTDTKADDVNDVNDDEPAVVRPSLLARSISRRKKSRLSTASTTSRLSFGQSGLADDDHDDNDDDNDFTPAVVTPKRGKAAGSPSLTQRVLETNAFRKSLSSRLPTRQRSDYDYDDDDDKDIHSDGVDDNDDDDNGRPRYSQAYLDELQNATPNTPVNLSAMQRQDQQQHGGRGGIVDDADLMDLDPSELDGAMLVDASELNTVSSDVSLRDRLGLGAVLSTLPPPPPPPPPPAARVLTETEIQERKDRRARRALEEESISLGASDDEQSGYISLLTDEQKRKRKDKEKESTRLVREDEDLGEGFDEFVEDKHAPLALGKKAEREARRRRKQEMADLISAAGQGPIVDNNNNDSDDSEAERRAAYDAAQTRAGMDGLHRVANDVDDEDGAVVHGGIQIPRMMSTLPDLADCLQQMQSALKELEVGVAQHRHRLAEVDQEKAEITARETEVQCILDAAAAKYQAILGGKNAKDAKDAKDGPSVPVPAFNNFSPMRPLAPGKSPLRALPPGLAGDMMPVERGLESLGTTPTRRPQADDYF